MENDPKEGVFKIQMKNKKIIIIVVFVLLNVIGNNHCVTVYKVFKYFKIHINYSCGVSRFWFGLTRLK